mgnify:CR=1 FL=1
MISKISVCLEVGPQATGAFVPDYPGCWVIGHTKESALDKVRIAIGDWIKWVNKHGEKYPDISNRIEVEVAEMLGVNYNPAEAGKPEPLFWSEVPPVEKEDIARTIRLMGYSRKELLGIVNSISDECMDWKPPSKPRTIRNCLEHIAIVEPWYISRVNIYLPEEYPEDVIDLLNHTRDIVIDCLNNFPERKMKGVFQPRKYKSPICNLWTTRKMLRRFVDHERIHTRYIENVLKMYNESKGNR